MNQTKFHNQYRIPSNRLRHFDYSTQGAYFLTICTHLRQPILGNIANGRIVLTELGQAVKNEWLRTPQIRKNITLDEFVVMPNHIHGIMFIDYKIDGTVSNPQYGTSQTIGAIVRGFKIGVTNYACRNLGIGQIWQSNYHDHIIRDDDDLNRIRQYIRNNPANWETDRNNTPDIYM